MVTSTYYKDLLDNIYDGIEGLSTVGYRGTDSDTWHRSRSMVQSANRGHLLCLLWFKGRSEVRGPYQTHEVRAVFSHRYVTDDDSTSQARIQAATDNLMDYLEDWSQSDGARVIMIDSTEVTLASETWADVAIDFILQTPRGGHYG